MLTEKRSLSFPAFIDASFHLEARNLKEKCGFLHIRPKNEAIFYLFTYLFIMYDVLQHYDELSWELELVADVTSSWKPQGLGAENVVLEDETAAECLVVSSHVPALKHKVELEPWDSCFSCIRKQTNSRFQLVGHCLTLCFSVLMWEDTTEHLAIIASFKTTFLTDCWYMPLSLSSFQLAVT